MICLSVSECLIADRFKAQCKEHPSIASRKFPKRFVIRLKKSAVCEIDKECDAEKESIVIRKFERASFKVIIARYSQMIFNNGELKCDFCEKPDIGYSHKGHHNIPPFSLERIKEHPAVCIKNDMANSQLYAEINPEIVIKNQI